MLSTVTRRSDRNYESRMHFTLRIDLSDPDIHRSVPGMLYHYTDAAGLTGIVKSECRLSATQHHYVNDSDEIRFGHKIAVEALGELAIDSDLKALAIAKTDALLQGPSFIACLSAHQDILTQWRLYAKETAGYCLGFKDPRPDAYHAGEDGEARVAYDLFECVYGETKLRERLAQRFQRKIDRLKEVATDDKSDVLTDQLAQVAWRYAQLAKHEHFLFESEWRFVVWEADPVIQYRLTKRGLTPYLFTDKLKLEEVWIGPGVGPTPEEARDAVTKFLATQGLSPKVLHWKTSYRG